MITTAEAAHWLGISELTIRRAVARGELAPADRRSKPWMFDEAQLHTWQAMSRSQRWRRRHAENVRRLHMLASL